MWSLNMEEERKLNQSFAAPIAGVYRYELIPADSPINYHIDLWYQFSMGMDDEELLNEYDDAVYLKKGDYVVFENETVKVKNKTPNLRLVVNNDNN
jgi:hypothetical protein